MASKNSKNIDSIKIKNPNKISFINLNFREVFESNIIIFSLMIIFFFISIIFSFHRQRMNYKEKFFQVNQKLELIKERNQAELYEIRQDINKLINFIKKIEIDLVKSNVKNLHPNDWILSEIDYLIRLAEKKLYFEYDVISSIKLMEFAKQRLESLKEPDLLALKTTILNDINCLKKIILVDYNSIILSLINLQQKVDELPVVILENKKSNEQISVSANHSNWRENLLISFKTFVNTFIKFRVHDSNVVPLLPLQKQAYLKENIKIKLETAIHAIYRKQVEIYKVSLNIVDQWVFSFFDKDHDTVINFHKELNKLKKQNIQVSHLVKLKSPNILLNIRTKRLDFNV
ncbi:uroporphyrinogen-III C-methyltransferase [Candidatus Photodesmus katoptron]|uniref:uroporphyrinogen-III C-methyltransferase n=1 Tax=Candidatus Photodesmus anomalopis TaxID=28176 RepID=UPI0004DA8C38|nr:uroporphyrinogen-III C-methyltransferase [Candidatus Photodesmus katoptron]KEY90332.1 uroporphyrinogen-III C-methyltransferase [Candidatus Photodesmus katoptron]